MMGKREPPHGPTDTPPPVQPGTVPRPAAAACGPAAPAVVVIEDDRFFQHGLLDFPAIVRAAVTNIIAGGIVEGGSTTSQQLVKDTVTGDAPTFARQIREAADAVRLENTYSKEHILV